MKIITPFLLVLCISSFLEAQLEYADDATFKVEKTAFTPPTQAVLSNFEGSQATPFLANDQDNNELYLDDFSGKKVILWFWDATTPQISDMIRTVNMVSMDYEKDVKVISFMTQGRSEMNDFLSTHDVRFSVIPNGGILGEQMYGGSLGFPRMFFIDENGMIDKVVPSEYFTNTVNVRGMIDDIVRSM